jgi:hypothetical protein
LVVALGGGLDVETVEDLIANPGADVLPKLEVEEADLCKLGPTVLEVEVEEALVDELKELGPDEERVLGFDGKGKLLYLLVAAALDPAGTLHDAGRDTGAGVLVVVVLVELVSLASFSVLVGSSESIVGLLSIVFDDSVIDTLLPSFDTSFEDLREDDDKGVFVVAEIFAGTLGADFDERVDFGALVVTPLSSPSAFDFLRD